MASDLPSGFHWPIAPFTVVENTTFEHVIGRALVKRKNLGVPKDTVVKVWNSVRFANISIPNFLEESDDQ